MFPNKQPRLSSELEEDAEQNTNEDNINELLLPQDQIQPSADLPELMIVSPMIQDEESYGEMPVLIAESNSPPGRAENEAYLLDGAAGVEIPEKSANNEAEAKKSQTKSLKHSIMERELTKPLRNKKPRSEIPEAQEGPSNAELNDSAIEKSVPMVDLASFFKEYKFKNDHVATNELQAKKLPIEFKLEGRKISELEKELTKPLPKKEPVPKPVAPENQGASGLSTTVNGNILIFPENLLRSSNEFSSSSDSSVGSDLTDDEEPPYVSPMNQELPLESYGEMPVLIAESNSPPGRAENEAYLLDGAAGVEIPEKSANNEAEVKKSQTKSLKHSILERELTKPLRNKKPRHEIPEAQEGPSTAELNVSAREESVPIDDLAKRIDEFFKEYKFKNAHVATNELQAKKALIGFKLEGRNISKLEKELTKVLTKKESSVPKPVAPGIQGTSGLYTTSNGNILLFPKDLLQRSYEFSSPGGSSVVSDLNDDEESPYANNTAAFDEIARTLKEFFESKNGQAAANGPQEKEPPIEDEAEGRNISELEKELAKPLPEIEPILNPVAPEIQDASGSGPSTSEGGFLPFKTRIIVGGNTATKIENMLFISEDFEDSGDESFSSDDSPVPSGSSNDDMEEPSYVVLGPHTFTVVQPADSSDSSANGQRINSHVSTSFGNVQEEDVSSTIPGDEDEDEDVVE